MNPRHALGLRAEEAVARWMEASGWRILARRHRAPAHGEVDLVALDTAETLVAVEVRARRTARTGAAAFSVDRRRVVRLESALAAFASSAKVSHRGLRVDLVTAEPLTAGAPARWLLRRIPGIERC